MRWYCGRIQLIRHWSSSPAQREVAEVVVVVVVMIRRSGMMSERRCTVGQEFDI